MLDKIKSMLFPCEEVLRELRDEHSSAAQRNSREHENLKRICINKTYPQFCHLNGNDIVSPR